MAANGGQRTVTILIYLNDVPRGGATHFPSINRSIQPQKGMALVFFPATTDGILDPLALHEAQPALDPKYVAQIWIRQGNHHALVEEASKRLNPILGPPLKVEELTPPTTTATAADQQNQNDRFRKKKHWWEKKVGKSAPSVSVRI